MAALQEVDCGSICLLRSVLDMVVLKVSCFSAGSAMV